jgi:hypothetical protein
MALCVGSFTACARPDFVARRRFPACLVTAPKALGRLAIEALDNPSPTHAHHWLREHLGIQQPLQGLPKGLSLERDVEPNVSVLMRASGGSAQRVARLVRSHPQLLAAPLDAWQHFLLQYGIRSGGVLQLCEGYCAVIAST